VGIDALIAIMIVDVRTIDGFVLVLVELSVFLEVVEEFYLDFRLAVGEGAEVLVLAFVNIMRMLRTELPLVFIWVIKFFNFVVGVSAIVSKGTRFAFCDSSAEIEGVLVCISRSSSIFVKVVEIAYFGVMVAFDHAWLGLEIAQFELLRGWAFRKLVFLCIFNLFLLLELFKGEPPVILVRMVHRTQLGDQGELAVSTRLGFVCEWMIVYFVLGMRKLTRVLIWTGPFLYEKRAPLGLVNEVFGEVVKRTSSPLVEIMIKVAIMLGARMIGRLGFV